MIASELWICVYLLRQWNGLLKKIRIPALPVWVLHWGYLTQIEPQCESNSANGLTAWFCETGTALLSKDSLASRILQSCFSFTELSFVMYWGMEEMAGRVEETPLTVSLQSLRPLQPPLHRPCCWMQTMTFWSHFDLPAFEIAPVYTLCRQDVLDSFPLVAVIVTARWREGGKTEGWTESMRISSEVTEESSEALFSRLFLFHLILSQLDLFLLLVCFTTAHYQRRKDGWIDDG